MKALERKILKRAILLFAILAGFSIFEAKACEIEFEVQGEKKEAYTVGDEIIIKVTVILTHRVCPEGIKKTSFESDGLKVVGAKEWEQINDRKFERLLKVKVTGTENGKVTISATRTCDKDGGFGSITLQANPVKSG